MAGLLEGKVAVITGGATHRPGYGQEARGRTRLCVHFGATQG